jgi:rare lipoprotein A
VGQKLTQILFSIGLCLFLAACASGPEVSVCPTTGVTLAPKKATSRPYQINGIWYYPQSHYEYAEEGIASFYGGGDVFHGRPTATGERFDKNGITAAHKTVPLPCIAKVTNLENGRELIVKVNDRGPFVDGRIIDLSRRSAQLLGFENKGLAKVRVTTLVPESLALNGIDCPTVMLAQAEAPPVVNVAVPVATIPLAAPQTSFDTLIDAAVMADNVPQALPTVAMAEVEPAPTPETVASTGIFVHIGEYETQAKAQAMSQSLDGFADAPIEVVKYTGPRPYIARFGPLPSMAQANRVLDQLINAGHFISRIVIQH